MNKNKWRLSGMSIAVLAAVLLWAVAFGATRAEAAVGDLRILGGERTIREGETVKRNISVMGGELEVRKDAKIYGDITIFGGEAEFDQGTEIFGTIRVYGGEITVEGTVSEDIVVLGGEVHLKEDAIVEGNVKTVGGKLNRSRGSIIRGEVIGGIVDDFEVEFDPEEIVAERRAHFFPFGGFRTVRSAFTSAFSFLTNFLLIAAAALLLAIFAPKHVAAAETYLNKNRGLTWFIGAAVLFLVPVAALFLSITLILIPVALILILVYIIAIFCGFVVVASLIGKELKRRIQLTMRPEWLTFVGAVALIVVFAVFDALPWWISWTPKFFAATFGLGAVSQYLYEQYAQRGGRSGTALRGDIPASGTVPDEGSIVQPSAFTPAGAPETTDPEVGSAGIKPERRSGPDASEDNGADS
ncbi:hypothetical protein BEQ56_06915 [Anaerolineaceae bacterium oral taxon 439]|nr:hypothetical protein BEQ56_06915 [Anaerolineaceae bacterium oral taxon 439]